MSAIADKLFGMDVANPFKDSQGRNFSDTKIQKEFCPISKFWSLFNDHHEILLGARGSGKTFLLKMMRRSMLESIDHEQASKILKEKKYISFYVPLHMETVTALSDDKLPDERKIELFKFVFNSLLAESIIDEIKSVVNKIDNIKDKVDTNFSFASQISEVWFGKENNNIGDLNDLSLKIRSLSYNFDYYEDPISNIPIIFRRELAVPLLAIQPLLVSLIGLNEEPTWILCVDEAEFIPIIFQKCLNSFMRSNTHGIVMKIGTLPFYWKTYETFETNILLSPENDFCFQVLDLQPDSEDFRQLTDKLCSHRIKSRVCSEWEINCLEDFLGTIGKDKLIDYYRDIVGIEKSTNEQIIEDIINSFSDEKRISARAYKNKEKTIHQKYGHIFYVREVYKLARKGHNIPGWYAGADVIRKVSQGNPRQFITIMSCMFNRAVNTHFSSKVQHQVIINYAATFCKTSQAIESDGHLVYDYLNQTGNYLFDKVHNQSLISVGCAFKYRFKSENEFEEWKKWLEKAVAYSRIIIPYNDMVNGITMETTYTLSYAYAANYWIPFRPDTPCSIPTDFKKKCQSDGQMTIFDTGVFE